MMSGMRKKYHYWALVMQKVWMYWSVTTHLQVLETISGDTLGILPRNVTRISENPSLVRGKYLYFLMNPLTMPLKLHVIVPLNLIILLRNFIVIMHWQTCDVDQHQIPYFPNTCNLVYFQVSDMYIIILHVYMLYNGNLVAQLYMYFEEFLSCREKDINQQHYR